MQWREANRRRQRQTIRYRGLVPIPPPPPGGSSCFAVAQALLWGSGAMPSRDGESSPWYRMGSPQPWEREGLTRTETCTCGALKATFGAGVVCAAGQQGKAYCIRHN